jgi:GGDEF domain-containing protein
VIASEPAGLATLLADTHVMASVNLTCTTCTSLNPCARCRSIARVLRAAGHVVTQSSRYDALRAAAVGSYGFDACVVPVARDEHSVVDAAEALLSRPRVALVAEPGAFTRTSLPNNFEVIEEHAWPSSDFPVDWISAAGPSPRDVEDTQTFEELSVPPADLDSARRRLKLVARQAQREIGAAGFPQEARLDLLAALEDEIAWAKMSGTGFGIVLIHVAKRKTGRAPTASLDEALSFLRQRIAPVIRTGDALAQGTDSVLVIVAEATPDQMTVAASRIKKAIRRSLKDASKEKALSTALGRTTLGAAAYPTHGTTRAALLARATASAEEIARE